MKIDFKDGGYIDFENNSSGNIFVTIAAKHIDSPLDTIINTAEISFEQLKQLVESVFSANKE